MGAAQQVGSQQVGAAQQVGSQQVGSQHELQPPPWPRFRKPAWASLAKNETAPAASNRANKTFAFMGVLKKQEQDVHYLAERPTPFKHACDKSYWQQSSNLAGGVNQASCFHNISVTPNAPAVLNTSRSAIAPPPEPHTASGIFAPADSTAIS